MIATYPSLLESFPWKTHRRFVLSALLALVVHLLVVFGLSFDTQSERSRPALPNLEILLIQSKPEAKPIENAEFLSETNHQAEEMAEEPPEEELLTEEPIPVETPEPVVPPAPPASPAPVKKVEIKKTVAKKTPKRIPVVTTKAAVPDATPRASTLFSRSLAMAQLSAEVEDGVSSYASLPRQRHISANTREFKYSAYMDAWVKKVERMGNLNYPDQARKENLMGSLILDVSLRPDGEIEAIEFVKSSGFKVLDDAAVNIVRMSAPFAVFPAEIREETDLLHITRTWEFVRGNRLSGF